MLSSVKPYTVYMLQDALACPVWERAVRVTGVGPQSCTGNFLPGSHMRMWTETVALGAEGSLFMLDKFGAAWRAVKGPTGNWTLKPGPLTWLGPGRPLGFHLDKDGNLIVCNAGTVRLAQLDHPHVSHDVLGHQMTNSR